MVKLKDLLPEVIDEKKYVDNAQNRALDRVGSDWGKSNDKSEKPKKKKRVKNKPDFKKTGADNHERRSNARKEARKILKDLGMKPEKSHATRVRGHHSTTQKGYTLKSQNHFKYKGEPTGIHIVTQDGDSAKELQNKLREKGYDVIAGSNELTINLVGPEDTHLYKGEFKPRGND
mgnify:CR=1 FL=1